METSRISLRFIEGKNTWEGLAFQQLQASATTGGDVAHLVGQPSLLDSSNRVATANDGRDALGGSKLSQLLSNCLIACCKLLKLKDSHRSVPNDSVTGVQCSTESLDGIWANIKTHPTFRDSGGSNSLKMMHLPQTCQPLQHQ
uniref:Uncharacterized protein n=1 Tax=Oryza brachyantha TaxID=4533 RepID=J3L9Z4_ORYBR